MGEMIRVRVRRGMLEPLEKVDLQEGSEITLAVIQTSAGRDFEAFRRSAGAWKGTLNAEALIRDIYGSRLLSPRPEPFLETTRPPTAPQSIPWEAPTGGVARIGKSVVIRGELSGSEDLYIDGQVEGIIELREHHLTVGPNGRVQANIDANHVVILGSVCGNIRAFDCVEIRKSGSLVGDIVAARIVIEDGAFFKGGIDIQKSGDIFSITAEPKKAVISSPGETQTEPLGADFEAKKVH